jgi:hypothetical protein
MLQQFKRDKDGGLTLYLQSDSPGKEGETKWLPAANGTFSMIMRLYWLKEEALNGNWIAPALTLAD